MSRSRDAVRRRARAVESRSAVSTVPALLGLALPGAVLLSSSPLAAQAAVPPAPVIVEAEQGELGTDFAVVDDGTTQGITITSNQGGAAPGTAARIASYEITLPAAGAYDLYVRVFVGPATANDDSLFYGASFGTPGEADGDAWVTANNLSGAGYAAPGDVLTAGGFAGSQVWKWVRLSVFDGGETPRTLSVPEGELTQIFQLGGREDGLTIDKLAFVTAGVFQTVAQLDAGLPGTFEAPPPPPDVPPPYVAPGPPLATGKRKFLGNVYSTTQQQDFAGYFNQVTPENASKWGSVEGQRDVMNFAGLDQAFAFAREHGFPIKLHTLVWGNQQPSWVESLPPEEQLLELEEWFAALSERYPDIDQIEVVNEPLHDPPDRADGSNGNYAAALGGAGETGFDWVINAFRLARFYFPGAELMLNEYSVENDPNLAQVYLDLATSLQLEDLIDALGVQGHAFSTTVPVATLNECLDLLGSSGLPIYITELDIDGPTDAQQLAGYQRIFSTFWEHPAVRGVTLWGHRPGMWRTPQRAFLTFEDGGRRPALEWLEAYVRNDPPTVLPRQRFSVEVGAASGASVGVARATDEGTLLEGWSIVGGSGADLFAIDAASGEISLVDGVVLAADPPYFYTLELTVRDALAPSEPATVLIDVRSAPPAPANDAGIAVDG
jgi:endo-1,4-beta-xylanase